MLEIQTWEWKSLTNDIPNVVEEATQRLDENGMIRVGAESNQVTS